MEEQEENERQHPSSGLGVPDDMVLVSDSMDAFEEVLRSLSAVCSSVGLSISSKKTKILVLHPSSSLSVQPRAVQLKLGEEPVAVVE